MAFFFSLPWLEPLVWCWIEIMKENILDLFPALGVKHLVFTIKHKASCKFFIDLLCEVDEVPFYLFLLSYFVFLIINGVGFYQTLLHLLRWSCVFCLLFYYYGVLHFNGFGDVKPNIPINLTWSLCPILTCCCFRFANIFTTISTRDIDLWFSFFMIPFSSFSIRLILASWMRQKIVSFLFSGRVCEGLV